MLPVCTICLPLTAVIRPKICSLCTKGTSFVFYCALSVNQQLLFLSQNGSERHASGLSTRSKMIRSCSSHLHRLPAAVPRIKPKSGLHVKGKSFVLDGTYQSNTKANTI